MYIWINWIKKSYPYIDNKDIQMVIDINKPTIYEQSSIINWSIRNCKFYLKKDIEWLFGKINTND